VLWQAEGIGTLFEQSRVRRIERAQDALSLVEEKVYDILWGVRNQRRDEYRLVHYSLQRLAGEARINIKTVRELIPRLIDKEFIRIELAADPRKNTATLYRVWSYSSVLALQRQKNRQYVVKTGKGVFYARAVKASLDAAPFPLDDESGPMGVTPAGAKSAPTGAEAAPAGASPTGPMGGASTKPMGSGGTVSIDISEATTRQTSSSTYAAMIGAIQSAFGTEPDSGLLDYMIADCNRNAVEATGEPARDEELIYFTQSKARVLARAPNIRNHMAVLRRALPECFCGEAFRIYRQAAEAREKSAAVVVAGPVPDPLESEKLARWTEINERHRTARGYDLKAIAEDADLDEHGRTVARERLLRQGRYTEQGI
jgi:predicted transcriptional regulator